MTMLLIRSIKEPIRKALTWDERWKGADQGLIWCWERGRQIRVEDPDFAARAMDGELVPLAWKGGVEKKIKKEKEGTPQYLATWQGLRGEDLEIPVEGKRIQCTKTGQVVFFPCL